MFIKRYTEFEKQVLRFFEQNVLLLIFGLFFLFLSYGFSMFNFILDGDDWLAFHQYQFQYEWVVAIGRPIQLVLWKMLGDNFFVPVFTLLYAFGLIFISGILAAHRFNLTGRYKVFFLSFFVTCPFLIESLSVEMGNVVIGTGIFLSVLAFHFYATFSENSTKTNIVLAVLFTSLASLCYQALFPLIISGVFLFHVHKNITQNVKKVGHSLDISLGALFLSGIGYMGMYKVILFLTGTEPGKNPKYDVSISFTDILGKIDMTYVSMNIFFTDAQYYFPFFLKLAIVVGLLTVVYQILKIKHKRFLTLACLGIGIASPWLLTLLTGSYATLRYNVYISLIFVFAYLLFSFIRIFDRYKLVQYAFVALVLGTFIFQANVSQAVNYHRSEHDKKVIDRMLEIIEVHRALDSIDPTKEIHLIAVGKPQLADDRQLYIPGNIGLQNPPIYCGVILCKLEKLPTVLNVRKMSDLEYGSVSAYIKYGADKEESNALIDTLPLFPHRDSVYVLENNEILVKFQSLDEL